MNFNESLAKFIEDNHLNQAAVARDMGIDSSKLYATVNGKRKMDVDEFIKFCEVVKVDPMELLTYKSA